MLRASCRLEAPRDELCTDTDRENFLNQIVEFRSIHENHENSSGDRAAVDAIVCFEHRGNLFQLRHSQWRFHQMYRHGSSPLAIRRFSETHSPTPITINTPM